MKLSHKCMSLMAGCFLLAACTDPGYRPSSDARAAKDRLRDIEHAGEYLINGFNPCGKPQLSKNSGYKARVKLNRRNEIIPEADIRTSGTC